jgi:hypothetical protein
MRNQESAGHARMQEFFKNAAATVIFSKSFGGFQMTKHAGYP